MSLQHIQKNSPRLLPKPAKFEKNSPNGDRVIRKTKCGAGGAAGAGGAGSSPIHKQASLAGRLITQLDNIPEKLLFLFQIFLKFFSHFTVILMSRFGFYVGLYFNTIFLIAQNGKMMLI